jgi:hypothetical protein
VGDALIDKVPVGIVMITRHTKKLARNMIRLEGISRTDLHAELTIGAGGEIFYPRVFFCIARKNSGRTDSDAASAPMTKTSIDNAGKSAKRSGHLLFGGWWPTKRPAKGPLSPSQWHLIWKYPQTVRRLMLVTQLLMTQRTLPLFPSILYFDSVK